MEIKNPMGNFLELVNSKIPDWQRLANMTSSGANVALVAINNIVILLYGLNLSDGYDVPKKVHLLLMAVLSIVMARKILIIFAPARIKLVKDFSEYFEKFHHIFKVPRERRKWFAALQRIHGAVVNETIECSDLASYAYDFEIRKNLTSRTAATILLAFGLLIMVWLDLEMTRMFLIYLGNSIIG